MLLPLGNPIKCHEEFLYLQPTMFPPTKRLDNTMLPPSPEWVDAQNKDGLDAIVFFK